MNSRWLAGEARKIVYLTVEKKGDMEHWSGNRTGQRGKRGGWHCRCILHLLFVGPIDLKKAKKDIRKLGALDEKPVMGSM